MQKSVEQTLVTLKVLQTVDDQLAQLREAVASLTLRVDSHKKRVAELEAELQARSEDLKNEERESAKKDLDLKVLAERIEKLREQLNTLTSNKAYAAMMGEIGGHQAEVQQKEEDALKLMEKAENIRTALADIRKQIVEAKEGVKREEQAIEGEVQELAMRIRELSAERQGLSRQLDRMVLEKYEKISRSKQGKAVAAVKDGVCQGCFMGVTKQMILRLWSKKELVHCPNCARLIYLEGSVQ